MSKVTVDLFKKYKEITSVTLNPTGSKAVVGVKTTNDLDDGYDNNMWLLSDGKFRQITFTGKEGGAIWDDEDTLLYPAVKSSFDKKQAEAGFEYTAYYRLNVNGGESYPAFNLPLRANYIKKISCGKYLVVATVDCNHADYYKLDEEARKKIVEERKANKDFNVLDESPFYTNGIVAVTNKTRHTCFCYDETTNELKCISELYFDTRDTAVIGEEIFMFGPTYTRRPTPYFDIYKFSLATGETTLLFKNDCFDNKHGENMLALGEKLIVCGDASGKYGMDGHGDFYEVDKTTGQLTLIAESDRAFYYFVNGDDALYLNVNSPVNTQIQKMDCCGNFETLLDMEGATRAFDVKGNCLLASVITPNQPSELYAMDLTTKEVCKVSCLNDELFKEVEVSLPEKMTIKSHDWEVDGFVIKPTDFDPAKKYPAILMIHGGPKGTYYPNYNHPMQMFASKGYFVVFCNPKGSDGKGNEFAEIRKMHGTVDYEDIMNFLDAAIEKYPQIDTDKMGVTGISYGGYMTNWVIGHTNRFKAASSQCGIASWVSLYATSDISLDFVRDQMDGNIYDNIDTFWNSSPLKYANNCTTPTLFIQPINDYRCPLSEGLMMASALMDQDVETRVVTFDGDHHGVSSAGKPSHRVRCYGETFDWMNSHLGVE